MTLQSILPLVVDWNVFTINTNNDQAYWQILNDVSKNMEYILQLSFCRSLLIFSCIFAS